MRSNRVLIVAALAAAALSLVFATIQAMQSSAWSAAAGISAMVAVALVLAFASFLTLQPAGAGAAGHGWAMFGHRQRGRHHEPGHGAGGNRGGTWQPHETWNGMYAARMEHLIALVENRMNFTPPQADAWEKLADSLRAGGRSISDACDSLANDGRGDTAPAALTRAEVMVTVGLDALQQVRPRLDAFYATLDPQQKQIIDGLFARRRW